MSILQNHHMTRMAQALCAVLLAVSASYAAEVDLSMLTDSYTAQDGDVLSGTLGGNNKISIAEGATVTLKGVTIDGEDNDDYKWAGLTCEGGCTIKLADNSTNTVKGFYEEYPGIYVPEGSTLTIEGTGTLDASSNGYGAGIGGGYEISCGNIVIKGGEIKATGGEDAAGIGSGYRGSAGDITISGGTVTATGGENAAGIGSGYRGSAGAITISGGKVEATGGDNAAGIGSGDYRASAGDITISGGTVTATGGQTAAGIGTGWVGYAGDITITDGVTKVTATAGSIAPNSVGAGPDGSAGVVTVAGVETGNIDVNTFEFEPSIINYIVDKNNNIIASINGYDDHTKEFPDIGDTTVAGVIFNRNFATSGYSTILLPFAVNTANLEGVKTVCIFGGVEPGTVTQKAVRMDVVWKDDGRENVELDAYTPYLIETDGSFKVNGAVTIKSTNDITPATLSDTWKFVGMIEYKKWEDGNDELGRAYGFAATSAGAVQAGEFVKLGVGAYIYPLRAYLVKEQTALSAPPMPSDYSSVAQRASIDEELPDRMSVVIVDRNENGEEETTVIGSFDTRTGEFKFTTPVRNYDLKGRRLQGKPKARGAYYGKKVLAK